MADTKMQLIREWLGTRHVGQAFQPAFRYGEFRPFSKEDLTAVGLYKRRLPHWNLEGSTLPQFSGGRSQWGQPNFTL